MIVAFHRLRREEEGQALVLGAVLLLVLALGVLGTVRLGQQVHERMELQDAADAAAYSLAVQQARTFNAYAYMNRAQISQYVTILQLLSLDAMVLGTLVGLGAFAAVLKTVGELCSGAKRNVCAAIPIIGPALVFASVGLLMVERLIRHAANAILLFDTFVGEIAVPALVAANLFLHVNQQALRLGMAARLSGDEGLAIARRTAPKAEWWGGPNGSLGPRAVNLLRFEHTHLRESMELGTRSDPPTASLEEGPAGRRNWARRGLGELIHATRSGAWVYDRSFPGTLGNMLQDVEGMKQVGEFLSWLPSLGIQGHTRLLSEHDPTPDKSAAIYQRMERPGYSTARYPTGNAIGANFAFAPGKKNADGGMLGTLGLDQKHMASVTSSSSAGVGGWVCTWNVSDPYRQVGVPGLAAIYIPRLDCKTNRGRHPWPGLTPYMAFNAPGKGCDSFAAEFCQPDVWVALTLPSDGDETAGKKTAVARALAYYHRPGNWKEPPNFFNPYWRARLAPVGDGLKRLEADALDTSWLSILPSEWTDKVLTH